VSGGLPSKATGGVGVEPVPSGKFYNFFFQNITFLSHRRRHVRARGAIATNAILATFRNHPDSLTFLRGGREFDVISIIGTNDIVNISVM